MIEVKFSVSPHELPLVQQLTEFLAAQRTQKQAEEYWARQSRPTPSDTAKPEPSGGDVSAQGGYAIANGVIVDAPAPEVEVVEGKVVGGIVSEEDVIAAVRTLVAAKGLPAASQLLQEYGVKRATEIPATKRAEFVSDAASLVSA